MRASKNPSSQLAVTELIEGINAESEKQLGDILTPDQQAQLKKDCWKTSEASPAPRSRGSGNKTAERALASYFQNQPRDDYHRSTFHKHQT